MLVCTDGSGYTGSTYEAAKWMAERCGVERVRVLHVLERRDFLPMADTGAVMGFEANAGLLAEMTLLNQQREKLDRMRSEAILADARERWAPREIEVVQKVGGLADVLEGQEGDLLVLGKRGEHADFAVGHLGSNLERVLRSTTRPVLVTARKFRPIRRILLAYDGSEAAGRAIDFLRRYALDVEVHLLTMCKEADDLLSLQAGKADALRRAGYEVVADWCEGDAEQRIEEEVKAREIDLLVIGAYGHTRLRHLILGSTTTALVRDCKVPVLLFR